jgi:hypothetical protein
MVMSVMPTSIVRSLIPKGALHQPLNRPHTLPHYITPKFWLADMVAGNRVDLRNSSLEPLNALLNEAEQKPGLICSRESVQMVFSVNSVPLYY